MTVPLPHEPFVLVGNPPFNLSTKLVRRWTMADHFESGALIVEHDFAMRVSGQHGSTKVSAVLGAFLVFDLPETIRSAEFSPQPRVQVVIMTIKRHATPLVSEAERDWYRLFVSYLFERSRLTVGKSLQPLDMAMSRSLAATKVRDLSIAGVVALFQAARAQGWERRLARSKPFTHCSLPIVVGSQIPRTRRVMTDETSRHPATSRGRARTLRTYCWLG